MPRENPLNLRAQARPPLMLALRAHRAASVHLTRVRMRVHRRLGVLAPRHLLHLAVVQPGDAALPPGPTTSSSRRGSVEFRRRVAGEGSGRQWMGSSNLGRRAVEVDATGVGSAGGGAVDLGRRIAGGSDGQRPLLTSLDGLAVLQPVAGRVALVRLQRRIRRRRHGHLNVVGLRQSARLGRNGGCAGNRQARRCGLNRVLGLVEFLVGGVLQRSSVTE